MRAISLIATLFVAVSFGCSSVAFDIASDDSGASGDDGNEDGAATADTQDTQEAKDSVSVGKDSLQIDDGGTKDSDAGSSVDAADAASHEDVTHEDVAHEDTKPEACSMYCTDFGPASGLKKIGSACLTDVDCCSGDCFDSRPGDGVPGECVAPPSASDWCGGSVEWCASSAGKRCVL